MDGIIWVLLGVLVVAAAAAVARLLYAAKSQVPDESGLYPAGHFMAQGLGAGLAIGTALGVAGGAALDNVALGTGIGPAIGLALGAAMGQSLEQRNQGKERPYTAAELKRKRLALIVGLAAGGFLFVVLVLMLVIR